jgi:ABC-type polysaccharide/polyol phosphate export permease
MNEISINTPALLFPAISLLMLAYTNRFYAIATRVRTLHEEYNVATNKENIFKQIKNLRRRLNMIRNMQALGVASFLCCIICMYFIFRNYMDIAHVLFVLSILALVASLIISLAEIIISTRALELDLSDIEGLEKGNVLFDLFKRD